MVESDQQVNPEPHKPKALSRRSVLRGAGAAVLSLFLGRSHVSAPPSFAPLEVDSPAPPPTLVPESEPRPKLDMLVADITMETFELLSEHGMPNMTLQELASKLGVDGELTLDILLTLPVPEDETLATAMAIQIIKFYYGNHGDNVVQVMQSVDSHLGENGSPPELHSIPPIALKNFEIILDELGNPKVWLEIDENYLAEVFSQSPQTFVNLSLELGRIGMDFKVYTTAGVHSEAIDPMTVKQIRSQLTINGKVTPGEYELNGKPLTQEEYDQIWKLWGETHIVPRDSIAYTPIDGYGSGGNPRDSLKKMSNLAAKVPEKIIFAAGGNPTSKYGLPNVIGAKAELVQQNKWSENLFLIGFYGIEYGGEILPSGYGADYYVSVDDMDKLEAPPGTSYATPIAGRLVMRYIEEKGLPPTPDSVRKVLDAYSVEQPLGDVWDETTETTYRNQMVKVIDIASMIEALQQRDSP